MNYINTTKTDISYITEPKSKSFKTFEELRNYIKLHNFTDYEITYDFYRYYILICKDNKMTKISIYKPLPDIHYVDVENCLLDNNLTTYSPVDTALKLRIPVRDYLKEEFKKLSASRIV